MLLALKSPLIFQTASKLAVGQNFYNWIVFVPNPTADWAKGRNGRGKGPRRKKVTGRDFQPEEHTLNPVSGAGGEGGG